MSADVIHRSYCHKDITIANAASLLGQVDGRTYAGGAVYVPSALTAADICFEVAPFIEGGNRTPTFTKLRYKTGTLVRITNSKTAEASWYEIPAQVMQAGAFKIRSVNTASEAAVTQGAERALTVFLKS